MGKQRTRRYVFALQAKNVKQGQTAKENGLEPLAKILMSQSADDPYRIAQRFVTGNVQNNEAAVQGALISLPSGLTKVPSHVTAFAKYLHTML